MVDAVTPLAQGGLITIRSVAPEIADSTQNPTMLKAQIGQMVSGTIFGMDQSGEPLLKSDQGNLALKLPYHLPSGTDVVLRMEAAPGGGMRARIVSIDGQSPKDYEAQLSLNPGEAALTQDAVSLTPTVARAAAQAAMRDPVQQSQQLAQQLATLPGDTNPATVLRAAESKTAPAPALSLPEASSEASVPAQPQQGFLLSRSADLPALLQRLPAGFPVPPRLQSGSILQLQMLAYEIPAPPSGSLTPEAAPTNALSFGQMLERMNQRLPSSAIENPLTAAAVVSVPLQPAAAPVAQATLQNALAAMSGEALVNQPQSAATQTPNPTQFQAQVIGFEANGDALLHTPLGVVRMPQTPGLPLSEGMQVQIQWLSAANPSSASTASAPPGAPLPPSGGWLPLTDHWASLEDTVSLLAANLPPGASPLAHLPQPNGAMGMDILFFLNALQQGDAMQWIGKAAAGQLAGRGRQDLIRRLGDDFAALGEPLLHSPSPQWQALLFPVYAEGQLHQARLFVRRHPQDEKESTEDKVPDTRFVLELTLSSLGDMQLCGFVRKPGPQATQFDLILRCKRELSATQRADIQSIFESGAQLTGYKGQIAFQHSPEFPENPLESFKPRGSGVMA